ncbi:MAG TPA: N-acetylglucosamine-6-phosphate deacetylase [Bacilli bacterium]
MGKMLFYNANVYVPGGKVLDGGAVFVQDGKIARVFRAAADIPAGLKTGDSVDVGGNRLVPGFIDVHVHGGGGFDVMSGDPGDIAGMSIFHAAKGTTSFLATTLTDSREKIEKAVAATVKAMEAGTPGAEPAGIHLEGPFLNAERCGAQDPKYIRGGTIAELDGYMRLAKGNVRLITIAPEQEGNMEVVRYAAKAGITVSIGHSDANLATVREAIAAGATHVTHLFNGMRGIHHREPGTAGAALMFDELAVELICDGIHVHKDLVSYVYRVKPADKIVLITDCVQAAGQPDGEYRLADLPVILKDGQVRLKNADGSAGNLAGSSLTLDKALQNARSYTNKSLAEVLPSLTINPARQIGLDRRKGSIEQGKDADLVILDDGLHVLATYVKGKKVFG